MPLKATTALAACLALAACTTPDDRTAYLDALQHGGAACARVVDPVLRAECQAFAAGDLAGTDGFERAAEACAAIEHPTWRDECVFLAVERAGLRRHEGARGCARAGAFERYCLVHVTRVEAEPLYARLGGLGQEQGLVAEVRALTRDTFPATSVERIAWSTDVVIAHVIADRVARGPFPASECAAVSDTVCAWAYWVSLVRVPRELDLDPLCAQPVTPERARATGVRPFEPDERGIGQQVWSDVCRDRAEGAVDTSKQPFGGLPLLWVPPPPRPFRDDTRRRPPDTEPPRSP